MGDWLDGLPDSTTPQRQNNSLANNSSNSDFLSGLPDSTSPKSAKSGNNGANFLNGLQNSAVPLKKVMPKSPIHPTNPSALFNAVKSGQISLGDLSSKEMQSISPYTRRNMPMPAKPVNPTPLLQPDYSAIKGLKAYGPLPRVNQYGSAPQGGIKGVVSQFLQGSVEGSPILSAEYSKFTGNKLEDRAGLPNNTAENIARTAGNVIGGGHDLALSSLVFGTPSAGIAKNLVGGSLAKKYLPKVLIKNAPRLASTFGTFAGNALNRGVVTRDNPKDVALNVLKEGALGTAGDVIGLGARGILPSIIKNSRLGGVVEGAGMGLPAVANNVANGDTSIQNNAVAMGVPMLFGGLARPEMPTTPNPMAGKKLVRNQDIIRTNNLEAKKMPDIPVADAVANGVQGSNQQSNQKTVFTADRYGNIINPKAPLLLSAPKETPKMELPKANSNKTVITPAEKAQQAWDEGVKTAQNYVGHSDILARYPAGTTMAQAASDIKANTGVDLFKLADNLDKSQKTSISQMATNAASKAHLDRAAGAYPDIQLKPKNVLKPSQLDKVVSEPNYSLGVGRTDSLGAPIKLQAIKKGQLPPLMPNKETASAGLKMVNNKIPDTSQHIVSKTSGDGRGIINTVKNLGSVAYKNIFNDQNALNKMATQYEKASGKKLAGSDNPYVRALNTRSSDVTAHTIANEKLVNDKGEVVGGSLKDAFKGLSSKDMTALEDYMTNQHAITRMQRGEKVFLDSMHMTPEKSAQIVASYDKANPKLKVAAEKVKQFNHNLAKTWLVDTGVITKDTLTAWEKENPNYVPMNRYFNDLEMPKLGNGKTKSAFANQSNPVKQYEKTGSQRPIISPIESTIEHIDKYVKVARRNQVMQSLIGLGKENPGMLDDWFKVVKDSPTDNLGDINKTVKEQGISGLVDNLNNQFDTMTGKMSTQGNVITGLVNGQKVHVEVKNMPLLEALGNMNKQGQNAVVEGVRAATNVMKTLTTGINPVFSLASNVWRDIPTAFVFSKTTSNPVKFFYDYFKAIGSIARNDASYQKYKAVGGGHESPISADQNLLAESKARLSPGYISKAGIKAPIRLARKGVSLLENLNNVVETAPRLAEFNRSLKKTGDTQQALFNANDVTVNFKRKGKWSKDIDAFVPYLNAAMQGIDKVGREIKHNPASMAAKGFMSVTIPTVMLYMANSNNPNYQKLNNYTKDNYFLIPRADGTFYKIPKPRELGVAFGSGVERALSYFKDNNPDGFKNFTQTFLTNFAPPMRTIDAPFSDLRANKDFVGRPIVPGYMQGVSPRLQSDSNTSPLANKVGQLTNQSPKQIDYLLKSYTGFVGKNIIPSVGGNKKWYEGLKQTLIADPAYSNDVMTDFYDKKTNYDTAYANAKLIRKFPSWYNDDMRKAYGQVNTKISDIRKAQRAVMQNKNLPQEEKDKKTRLLQMYMVTTADLMNTAAKKPLNKLGDKQKQLMQIEQQIKDTWNLK